MKYEAVFLDFFGTLVYDDDEIILHMAREIHAASPVQADREEILSFWSASFRTLCEECAGASFLTQREIEERSLDRTLRRFECGGLEGVGSHRLVAYWHKPALCPDTRAFLDHVDRPVCIVSNIDRADLLCAMEHHSIRADAVVTSEDARAYKPRPHMFQMALDRLGLGPRQVLHVGDSPGADIVGAKQCGIDCFWLNRNGRPASLGKEAIYTGAGLMDVLPHL